MLKVKRHLVLGLALLMTAIFGGMLQTASAQTAPTLTGKSIYDVNIRATPGVGSAVIGVLPGGVDVLAVGRSPENNWIQIQYDTTTGWVASWVMVFSGDTALLPVTTDIQPEPLDPEGPLRALSPYNLNIRAAPDIDAEQIGRLPHSTEAPAIGRNAVSSWVKIDYQGLEGWVAAWLLILNGDIIALPVVDGISPPVPGTPAPTPMPGIPTPPSTPSPTGVTVLTPFRVNVRATPSIDGTIVTVLPTGTTVNAVGRNAGNNWIQIEQGNTQGWVAAWVVLASEATSTIPVTDQSAAVAIVGWNLFGHSTYDLVMRSGPDLNFGTLATIAAGTQVPLLGRTEDSDWIKISYGEVEGWVAAWVLLGNGDFNNLPAEATAPAAP